MAPRQSQNHSTHATSSTSLAPPQREAEGQDSEQAASPRQSSLTEGLNTTTVVGALLGVAAGAALTYGFVSNNSSPSKESPQRPRKEQHAAPQRGTTLPRRATFPEKPVTSQHRLTRHEDIKPTKDTHNTIPRRLADPNFQAFGPVSYAHGDGDDDVDYGVTSISPIPPRFVPEQVERPASHARSRASSRGRRAVEDVMGDSDNRYTTAHSISRASSIRARSETPRERVPLTNGHDWERRSHMASSKPPSVARASDISRPPLSRSHRSHVEPDRESYVSARSRRSGSTTRPRDREHRSSEHQSMPGNRASSRVSAVTAREMAREVPARASSHVSARRVPLPRSAVGSSHAHWDPWEVPLPRSGVGSSHADWDDDMISLAPSDSISCAGSRRRSRKSHH